MATKDDVPTLRSVVQRFEDSAEFLGRLDESLTSLAIIRSQQLDGAQSLQSTSEQLAQYANTLSSANELIRDSLEKVKASLEAADKFIEGTDLNAVQQAMERTETAVKASVESSETRDEATKARVEALSGTVNEMFVYLKSELKAAADAKTQAETEKARLQSELDEIQRKIGYLTPRVRMKAGL